MNFKIFILSESVQVEKIICYKMVFYKIFKYICIKYKLVVVKGMGEDYEKLISNGFIWDIMRLFKFGFQ